MGRGSSAIYDECQSYFVMTADDAQSDKRVTHEKDRALVRSPRIVGIDRRRDRARSQYDRVDLGVAGRLRVRALLGRRTARAAARYERKHCREERAHQRWDA